MGSELSFPQLQFIDSTGLATIIRAHQAMIGAGGAGGRPAQREPRAAHVRDDALTTLLMVADDRAAAIQALG